MQTAIGSVDRQEYTATQLSQFSEDDRAALRGHLLCPYCAEPAYYRAGTASGVGRRTRSPHFFSRPHGENCDFTRTNADPWESEDGDGTVASWEERGKKLIVQIQMDTVSPAGTQSDGSDVDEGQRTQRSNGRTKQSNNVRRGPQRLLEQLVEWPSFKTSSLLIRMPDTNQTEMPVHTAFVRFEQANSDAHTSHWHGFWGVVPSLTYWARGESYYANFGPNDRDFRIAIHNNHVPAILERYRLSEIRDLVGGYFLLFDIARVSTSGRFTADVNSVNHVGFLRAR